MFLAVKNITNVLYKSHDRTDVYQSPFSIICAIRALCKSTFLDPDTIGLGATLLTTY